MPGGFILIGVTQLFVASGSSNPTFRLVAGLLVIVGGGVVLFSAERETRNRRKATPRPAEPNVEPRVPP